MRLMDKFPCVCSGVAFALGSTVFSRAAGITVAQETCVIRLSEFITFYLAVAAPFGVAHFMRSQAHGRNAARTMATAVVAGLLWPLTAITMLRGSLNKGADAATDNASDGERRIELAKRALANSLHAVEDVLESALGECGEAERHTLFAAREAVERYVGLTLATRGTNAGALPTAREMELCRIAGRTGDDLLNAGRCLHRRNVTRLVAHRERARAELVHALAAMRETANACLTNTAQGACLSTPISEAMIRALARAVELLSLLEDRSAVLQVARLLDAECQHLRRLEAEGEPFGPHVNVQSPAFGLPSDGGLKARL